MEDAIEVSVICNTYNHEKYIRDALEGFLMQKTTFPFEILIHDDASTDGTAKIIREYEEKYHDLIKPIYEAENQYSKESGLIKKIQIARAKGKYIAMCEGDDYWISPDKLQKQYDFMEKNPEYTLCGCSTRWLNMLTGKAEVRSRTDYDKDLTVKDFLLPKNGRPFPTVSFFLKKEIWENLPRYRFPVGDLPLTYYAAMTGKVRMLSEEMCVYRWFSDGSWTAQNGAEAKRAETCEKMILALENMNQGTDYQYDDIIKEKILSERYTLALMRHDFRAIKSDELIGIYQNRDFIHRLSDRIRCGMPGLYSIAQKLIGRNQ